MNRLSNSSSPMVTAVVTPSALMISGTVFEWPTTRTLPLAAFSSSISSAVSSSVHGRHREAERLRQRRGGLLRALELGREDRRDLRVLQHRRERSRGPGRPPTDPDRQPSSARARPCRRARRDGRGRRRAAPQPERASEHARTGQGSRLVSASSWLLARSAPGLCRATCRDGDQVQHRPPTTRRMAAGA